MEILSSRENGRIKEYVKLCRSKRFRENQGRFTIEGEKLFVEALSSDYPLLEGYWTEDFYRDHTDLAALCEKKGIRIALVSPSVSEKMTAFSSPAGVYGICRMKMRQPERELPVRGGFLGLWDLQDPGNVGTILRAADAFGIDGVLLSKNCADLYNPKTVKAAMGSLFRVPAMVVDMEEYLRQKPAALRCFAAVLDDKAKRLGSVSVKNSLVMIGNEGNGLSKEQAALCGETLIIPMKGQAESLNAAMAATVVLWEMAR